MSDPTASTSEKPPQEEINQPSLSFTSLPDDIILNCLVRVPRIYDLNLSCVSRTLRSLVRSPELERLRSCLPKKSVYLFYYFAKGYDLNRCTCHWISLRRGEKTTDYQLKQRCCSSPDLPSPCCASIMYPPAVTVGSEIYFIGGDIVSSTKLLILDTLSDHIRVGPSMNVARWAYTAATGVVDGKIYVIGGSGEESQVEVFDPKTQTWKFASEKKVKCKSRFTATVDDKVYMVDFNHGRLSSYSRREGITNESTERLSYQMNCFCVVENVLFACFNWSGLMWFDTKLKVWRKLVDFDRNVILLSFNAKKMAEYEGKLVVFWSQINIDSKLRTDVWCSLIALNWLGAEICAKSEWSGVVATFPYRIKLEDCIVVSD